MVCSMTSGAMKQGVPQKVLRARYCLWDQEGSRCREFRDARLLLLLLDPRTVVGEEESRLGWVDKTPEGVPHEVRESERSRVAATPKSASMTLPASSIKMFSACRQQSTMPLERCPARFGDSTAQHPKYYGLHG